MKTDKEKPYDAVFNMLSSAEMHSRNGEYWSVYHTLSEAAAMAKKYAIEAANA